jgi:Holliday junction resolvasome RuvABC ATP-dependent DNA helicase subunit
VGKTTLARIVANTTKSRFKELSATSHGVNDVKKVFEEAANELRLTGGKTIIFMDEIHRFTKAQQDVFLPFVEKGTITLYVPKLVGGLIGGLVRQRRTRVLRLRVRFYRGVGCLYWQI